MPNSVAATNRNVGVFIDAENLFKGYGKLDIPDMSMASILRQLEDAASREAGAGSIAVARAFADWNALGLEDFRRDVERSGVETVQVFSAGIATKNAADIVLVVDCLRSASDLEQLEVFIIVSGDGDFVPLVRRLHELNKYVVGATLAGHGVNTLLQNEVDQYVELRVTPVPPAAALKPVFSGHHNAVVVPAKKTSLAKKTPPPKKVVTAKKQPPAKKDMLAKKLPAPAKTPSKGADSKPNWHAMAKDIPVIHDGPAASPADYKAVIKKVLSDRKVRSFCDQLANHGGTLPILAMAIKAGAPKVSPSDARVSTLSRALRFALAGTQYALARKSDDVQPVLVRRSADPPGILPDLSLDDIQRGVQ
ncbi:MAG: NYN domain-containing protein [Aeromicrobium sp.]